MITVHILSLDHFLICPVLISCSNFSTADKAKTWCENTECPEETKNKADCCIYHVNIHTCPKADGSLCGPWLKHDGSTYTHSDVLGIPQ